jgi:hypothetical protein
MLGVAELLVALASDVGLPSVLALLMVGIDAVIASLVAGAIGIVLWATSARPSYSALVGAMVGVLLWTSFSAPLWTAWGHESLSAGALARFGIGSVAIAGIGLGVARFADRSERAGVPASAPLVWAATALLLAGAARLAYDGPTRARESLAGLAIAGTVLAAAAALAGYTARQRGSGALIGFEKLLVRLTSLAGCVAYAPLIATWILFDGELSPIPLGPPNILALAIDHSPNDEHSLRTIEFLARTGQRYEIERVSGGHPQVWLSSRAEESPVTASLFASGHATGAIVRDPRFASGIGVPDVDARSGGRGKIAGPASWMSGAPLLAGPGGALVALLEFGDETRIPARVGAQARTWLERWRTTRAGSPFFLLVDFRGQATSVEEVDDSIGALLDTVDQLGAGMSTLVVVLLDPPSADEPLRVVLRAPMIWGEPGSAIPQRLGVGELGDLILGFAIREAAASSVIEEAVPPAMPSKLPQG